MALFDKEGYLIVKDKQFVVGDVLAKLSHVKGEYLAKFLQDIGLNIPRKMRMGALKNVLRESVEKTIEERKSLADEMGYRLTWFSRYTDTQLVHLLEWYKNPGLSAKYLDEFWKLLLPYLVEKGLAEADLLRLFEQAEADAKAKQVVSSNEFNTALDKVLFDEHNEIDGVSQEAFRPVLYKASTLTELRTIGDKFNAPIPKRLKKNEMLDIILKKLQERGELTKELEEKLRNQNIILLERYAKDHDIKVSTELKKEEIIEFILSNAKETKETYYVPSSSAVYEKQVDEVEESVKVEPVVVVQEKIVEQQPEPVNEVKPEPVKEVVQVYTQTAAVNQIDYREQFDRLAKSFETLAEVIAKKEFVVNVEANPVVNVQGNAEQPAIDQQQPVQEAQVVQPQMTSKERIIAELLKDDNDDFPETIDSLEAEIQKEEEKIEKQKKEKAQKEPKHKKTGGIHPFLLIFTFILLLASTAAWGYATYYAIDIAFIQNLGYQALIDVFGFTLQEAWVVLSVSALAFLINLIATFRVFNKKQSKKSAVFMSFLLLITLAVPEALFYLIAHTTKVEQKVQVAQDDSVGRIVEAINNISIKSGTTKKQGKGFFGTIGAILGWIIVLAALLALIVFALWRLDFTYGYENIDIVGPFIRDYIMEPIFGSSHYLTQ